MDESEIIAVPHDRVGAIIGKGGETRKKIEYETKTRLIINSEEGEVEIISKGDALKHWKAAKIVKAIARGFSPEHAMRLLDDETSFEIIEMQEFTGKSENAMRTKRGRVIGEHGMARERIERDTGANISVYGKTIGIIGRPHEIEKAKAAVTMLLEGSGHESVFQRLERPSEERFEL